MPDPGKTKAVDQIEAPKNVKELQAFLGLINYYRKFIPRMAEIAQPLTSLLKKGVQYEWTAECQKAMEILKGAVTRPPILRYVDFTKPMILTTDASNGALGAVLSQEDGGAEFPIYFASKTLSPAEGRYSTIEKEFLAIVWAARNYRVYLLGRHFTVFTDHKPLVGITNLKNPSS